MARSSKLDGIIEGAGRVKPQADAAVSSLEPGEIRPSYDDKKKVSRGSPP